MDLIEKGIIVDLMRNARIPYQGMANKYGVTAGEEMLTTINYARSHQLPVAFIDMNAQHLFKRMLRTMSISEKIKLIFLDYSSLKSSNGIVNKIVSTKASPRLIRVLPSSP